MQSGFFFVFLILLLILTQYEISYDNIATIASINMNVMLCFIPCQKYLKKRLKHTVLNSLGRFLTLQGMMTFLQSFKCF